MKSSRRAMRMQRHHARKRGAGALNMVSLMDIFTILVFFLLVSSTTAQDLPRTKDIKLPESIADKLPKENVVIMVSAKDILVQGEKVASVSAVMASNKNLIVGLQMALRSQAARRISSLEGKDGKPINRPVTIMGDKDIPYKLLKKIMFTSTKESFGKISLAVMRKSKKDG
ncbi:MAG: ExbD/TolR family protein [Thiohalomonadales bacterium]